MENRVPAGSVPDDLIEIALQLQSAHARLRDAQQAARVIAGDHHRDPEVRAAVEVLTLTSGVALDWNRLCDDLAMATSLLSGVDAALLS
jgi:hypothetical protein